MNHHTTETYSAKREILAFAEKLSKDMGRPDKKFLADMVYGMIASESVHLSDIARPLREDTKKINTVDRLSRHLAKPLPDNTYANYIASIKNDIPDSPVVLLDDSDVAKPHGRKFEAIGYVKDEKEAALNIIAASFGAIAPTTPAGKSRGYPASAGL